MKNGLKRKEIVSSAILWAYLVMVLFAKLLLNQSASYQTLAFAFILLMGIAAVISPVLLKVLRSLHIIPSQQVRHKGLALAVLSFVLSLSVLLVNYAAYYPGGFSDDSIWQYEQAVTGIYSDWHPVLHTLLFFKLPLLLTGNWQGSIVLFQMIEFSLVLSVLVMTICRYAGKKIAFAVLGFILLNPVTGSIVLYPWKDVAIAMLIILLMCMTLHIHASNGEWLHGGMKIAALAGLLAAATILRHNAILFTLPLLLGICMYIGKKRSAQVVMLFVAGILLVKGPVYSLLDVQKPGSRQSEMLGLPMTVIGNVVKEKPQVLDQEQQEFVYAVASQEDWEKYYDCGNFNSIKWQKDTNVNAIDEAGATKVFSVMIQAFLRAPGEALRGLIALTDMVFAIDGQVDWWTECKISSNNYGLAVKGNAFLQDLLWNYEEATRATVGPLFWNIGMMNLIVLACILAKTRINHVSDLKRALLALPMLLYNYGTMLLLTGKDFRFFFFSFQITPLIVVLMLYDRENLLDRDKGKAIA